MCIRGEAVQKDKYIKKEILKKILKKYNVKTAGGQIGHTAGLWFLNAPLFLIIWCRSVSRYAVQGPHCTGNLDIFPKHRDRITRNFVWLVNTFLVSKDQVYNMCREISLFFPLRTERVCQVSFPNETSSNH